MGLKTKPINQPTIQLMIINSRKTPNSFQRCPLVSSALRFMLVNGPSPSTTQAGNAIDHRTANMMPGTIKRSMPAQIPSTVRTVRPTMAQNRESPFRSSLDDADEPSAQRLKCHVENGGLSQRIKKDHHGDGEGDPAKQLSDRYGLLGLAGLKVPYHQARQCEENGKAQRDEKHLGKIGDENVPRAAQCLADAETGPRLLSSCQSLNAPAANNRKLSARSAKCQLADAAADTDYGYRPKCNGFTR